MDETSVLEYFLYASAGFATGAFIRYTGLLDFLIEGISRDSYAFFNSSKKKAKLALDEVLEVQKNELSMVYDPVPDFSMSYFSMFAQYLKLNLKLSKLEDKNLIKSLFPALKSSLKSVSRVEGRANSNHFNLKPLFSKSGFGLSTVIHELGHIYMDQFFDDEFDLLCAKYTITMRQLRGDDFGVYVIQLFDEGIFELITVKTLEHLNPELAKEHHDELLAGFDKFAKEKSSIKESEEIRQDKYHLGYVLNYRLFELASCSIPRYLRTFNFLDPEGIDEILFKG